MKKEFKLTTHDIQKLWMCVCFTKEGEDVITMTKEDKENYLDLLSQLNDLCWVGNNYTINVTANSETQTVKAQTAKAG